jgi:hypothetical protein
MILLGAIMGFSVATIVYAGTGGYEMRDYRDLLADMREHDDPLMSEAAEAIEVLAAELHRATFIIHEQARENALMRDKLKTIDRGAVKNDFD